MYIKYPVRALRINASPAWSESTKTLMTTPLPRGFGALGGFSHFFHIIVNLFPTFPVVEAGYINLRVSWVKDQTTIMPLF